MLSFWYSSFRKIQIVLDARLRERGSGRLWIRGFGERSLLMLNGALMNSLRIFQILSICAAFGVQTKKGYWRIGIRYVLEISIFVARGKRSLAHNRAEDSIFSIYLSRVKERLGR